MFSVCLNRFKLQQLITVQSILYLSSVVNESIAEKQGIQIGDCILAINGNSFKDITHKEAVEIIQNHSHLNIKIEVVQASFHMACFVFIEGFLY